MLGTAGSTAVAENGPRNERYATIPTITHFLLGEKRRYSDSNEGSSRTDETTASSSALGTVVMLSYFEAFAHRRRPRLEISNFARQEWHTIERH